MAGTVEVHLGDGVSLPIPPERAEAAARWVLAQEGVAGAELSIAFVSDRAIERLNREYLSHEGPTDVISFPLNAPGQPPVGDVYVGVEQAERQAADLGLPLAEEILRLVVHGTLHVLGYDHPEEDGRDASPMYRRQEELLEGFLRREGESP